MLQIFNLILPRVNVRRTCAWYKDGEQEDFSPWDSQVPHALLSAATHLHTCLAIWTLVLQVVPVLD